MAKLDKLNKSREQRGEPQKQMEIKPSTRAVGAARDTKSVLIRLHPDDHARLRRKTFDEGTSIQQVVEQMILGYIHGAD